MFYVVLENVFMTHLQSRKHTVKMYVNKDTTNNLGVLFRLG